MIYYFVKNMPSSANPLSLSSAIYTQDNRITISLRFTSHLKSEFPRAFTIITPAANYDATDRPLWLEDQPEQQEQMQSKQECLCFHSTTVTLAIKKKKKMQKRESS